MGVARRVERVGQGGRAAAAGGFGTLGDVGPDRVGDRQQQLHPTDRQPSTVTGWLKTIPVPNVESAVGVPNVAGAAALTAGTMPASSPTAMTAGGDGGRRRGGQAALRPDHGAHARPAIRTMPRPFWPAPSSPVRDSAQPGP